MVNRYVLYVRKSQDRDDRQIASIDDQITEMTMRAKRNGYIIVKIFSESKSAKKPGRPVFNEMMEYMKKEKIHGLICWKLNRVARNAFDAGLVTEMLQCGVIKHISSSDREYYPTDNVLMILIDFGIATQYSKDLSSDIKRGLRNKAKNGWYPYSTLPIGYLHNPIKDQPKQILKDKKRFLIVKELWRLILTNAYSVSELKRIADKMGLTSLRGTSFARSSLFNLFTNPFYCGYFVWNNENGESIKILGHHDKMITEAQFNQVQRILGSRSQNSAPRGYDFTYRGLISCGECSHSVIAQRKKQIICSKCKNKSSIIQRDHCKFCNTRISEMIAPTVIEHIYYGCSNRYRKQCSQKFVNEKVIEKAITDALRETEITKKIYDWCKTKLENTERDDETKFKLIESMKEKKRSLQRKVTKLIEMRINEEISEQESKEVRENYNQSIKQLEIDIVDQESALETFIEETNTYLDFSFNCVKRFENASVLDKKIFIRLFCENLRILDKSLYFSTKKPLVAAFGNEYIEMLKSTCENPNSC